MSSPLPVPDFIGLLNQASVQPIAIVAAAATTAWYLRSVRVVRGAGVDWPVRRTAVFVLGVVVFAWTTCGWLEVYRSSLFWAWTTQTLILLLVVPLIVLGGQPLQLARQRSGESGLMARVLRSRTSRVLANPLVGPALVPVLAGVLFFGPVPSWAVQSTELAWVIQIVVVLIGGLIVLPLVGPDQRPSSLAVGLSLAIGSLELVLDAVPGIALRLHASLVTPYFDHRTLHTWSPGALHDQQIAGAILWCVAEIIDLPFLLLVFHRWLRADARDAAEVDAVLEAERSARVGIGERDQPPTDAPWWLTDPAMQRRYRNRSR